MPNSFSNISKLKLEFDIEYLNNTGMSLSFNNNGIVDTVDHPPNGRFVYETTIKFPADFEITVSGKGANDTVIDSDGKIIADKHVKIVNIVVDGMSCHPYYTYNLELTTNDGQVVKSNYWGFNGTVKLNFSEDNSFFWALHSADA